ncbi:MAG: DUF2911 domain-containing protein [Bacteroidia bacterium]
MKNLLPLLMMFLAGTVLAQELPQPSPAAKVEQTVGLTQIDIVYSRPGAKGRTIFGDLVPYNEIWRTAANKATAVTFSQDITFGGKEVKAGTYSLFTVPGEKEWTVMLNTETELWGAGNYNEENEVASVKVKSAKTGDYYETFTISFDNLTDESANMNIVWENTKVSVKIGVDTEAAAWANVESAIVEAEGSWRVYTRAADYAARSGKNLDKAIEWTEKSLAMNDYWWTYWVQAEVYAAKKDYKSAQKSLKKSIALGEEIEGWGYGERLNKLMEDYKSKS